MKKYFILFISIICFINFINNTYALNILKDSDFRYASTFEIYNKLDTALQKAYGSAFKALDENGKISIENKAYAIKNQFIELDKGKKNKDKKTIKDSINEIRKILISMIEEFKQQKTITTKNNENKEVQKLGSFTEDSKNGDLMYYADSFEGKKTSNGNTYSQKYFSAAKCGIPLNTLIQVWLGNKSLILKVNDRPSCSRFPNLIDMTTIAFDFFYERYKGTQKGEYITLGTVDNDYYKKYLDSNSFQDKNVTINEKIPNSYLLNETIHLKGSVNAHDSALSLILNSPSGKKVTLEKNVDRFFDYSYPLEEIGTYKLKFDGSKNEINIYVLDGNVFNGKKFISKEIEKNNIKLVKIELGKNVYGYSVLTGNNKYNMIEAIYDNHTYYYSGIGDVIIPYNILNESQGNDIYIKVRTSETLTNFSHDFYIEPIEIFNGIINISE